MNDPTAFAKMVPGFEFLQGLVKNAGAALPNVGQWIAPTLNPEELEKRIEELRTVQFWLEQNARMLGATIQALEVQRMTLSTLKTMNLPLTELRDALKVQPAGAAEPAAAPARKAAARKGSKAGTKAEASAVSRRFTSRAEASARIWHQRSEREPPPTAAKWVMGLVTAATWFVIIACSRATPSSSAR